MKMVIEMNEKQFATNLVNWYEHNKRDLPWRKSKNPYHIWLSEIMLQQTQVQTVIPYYHRFLAHFPTIETLANANLEEVYKCWEGLGYYSRARHLQEAAKQIIALPAFPQTVDELLKLKGIGPYTAAAIASIAFEVKKGVVDGNVLRILARVYEKEDNIALDQTKKSFQKICDDLMGEEKPSSFNQALMDLGATICKPRHPLCDQCPISSFCLANLHHKQNILPVNIKNIKHKETHFITCLIQYQNQYFLLKNESGLLAQLYGLPQYEVESPHAFEEAFYKDYHENIEIYEKIKKIKHVFTHRTWHMHVYLARFIDQPHLPLYSKQAIEQLPIATAHKKIINLMTP